MLCAHLREKTVLVSLPAVMGPVWFDADTFGTFKHDLTLLEAQLGYIIFGSISSWHSTLKRNDKHGYGAE